MSGSALSKRALAAACATAAAPNAATVSTYSLSLFN
jgi:hypothetical protein